MKIIVKNITVIFDIAINDTEYYDEALPLKIGDFSELALCLYTYTQCMVYLTIVKLHLI